MISEWNKTTLTKDRLKLEGKLYEVKGVSYYEGRPIISRDTPIDGGVYLGQGMREAIVVDSKKYPAIGSLYEKAKAKTRVNGEVRRDKVLGAVYDTVKEAMKYDEARTEEIVKKHGAKKDGKIKLDHFIEEEFGICRHQALTCGVLLELFKNDRFIRGKPSVDRNSIGKYGHAWCRYTSTGVAILDVAQGYFGNLEDAPSDGWDYKRPEERQKT